jgi:DNA-binding transcriptional LysR family regulator
MVLIVAMHETDLRNVDFQLLVALRALIEERSVSRAARRLNLSQPAMSRVLARLRLLFSDPLLVRGRQGLLPTPRALGLLPALGRLLEDAARLVAPQHFDPGVATGAFHIAANDYAAQVVLPGLLARLRAAAPKMDINIRPNDTRALEDLESGRLDLALGVFREAPAGFYRQELVRDHFVTLLRRRHPALKAKFTMAAYLKLPHLFVTLSGQGVGTVDVALKQQGYERRIAARVSTFMAVPGILQNSDLALTLPALLADYLCQDRSLKQVALPFRIAPFAIAQLWHERRQADAAHVWLRRQVKASLVKAKSLG